MIFDPSWTSANRPETMHGIRMTDKLNSNASTPADDAPLDLVASRIRGDERTPLTTEHAARIRQRVLAGVYNSPAIVDELARRILKSGEL